MEHLDLAGVITTPTSTCNPWLMPEFEQQDAIYLSSSRQMLEPILEETSEDEEHAQNSWNQYETATSFWSSAESETGSVIRIEVHKDADSISERDFACPAKRARRSDEFLIGGTMQQQQQPQQQHNSLDDAVILRKYQRNDFGAAAGESNNSLERFLALEAHTRDSYGSQQRNSTGSRRFDDFYSESDSLSYQSLSRSSSLIQFESLERQLLLQEQHASMSSLGNSSPSLLSIDSAHAACNGSTEDASARSVGSNSGSNSGNNSRRGSQSSLLKRFESSDGRLHQTYFDLDKLNFDDDKHAHVLFGASKTNLAEATIGEVKSDSESSSTSSTGSSSGNSILTASKPSAEDLTDYSGATLSVKNAHAAAFQRGKSSAENLSEDSGYCEPSNLRRTKSKSIPKNFEKFCEEDEFRQYDYDGGVVVVGEHVLTKTHADDDDVVDDDDDDADDDVVDLAENGAEDVNLASACAYAQNTHSKNSNNNNNNNNAQEQQQQQQKQREQFDARIELCQPKINADATFLVESDATQQRNTAAVVAAAATNKNSTTPQQYDEQQQQHHRRSLAHSPSPVSSDASTGGSSCCSSRSARSSTSASSTCASTASFTWLPKQQQQQQEEVARALEATTRHATQLAKQTDGKFCSVKRNSLPDIRDALSSDAPYIFDTFNNTAKNLENGCVLEHSSPSKLNALDDSDIATATATASSSASSSSGASTSSAHDSRSGEETTTDVESTPEAARKRSSSSIIGDAGGSGGGGGGSRDFGFVCGAGIGGKNVYRAARNLSVPNELDKLGRRKRVPKCKYSRFARSASNSSEEEYAEDDDDDEEEADDFFDVNATRIRRSCSWSERRERNLQRFERAAAATTAATAASTAERLVAPQLYGYMNASYQDLTQLDYNADKPPGKQLANYKRGSMEKQTHSGADYEDIICKGNFLLDELSEIYDRNASILTDKPAQEERVCSAEEQLAAPTSHIKPLQIETLRSSPKPPPRQRKHSNSSYSDLDGGAASEPEVQHVQLTLRRPPARQKYGRKHAADNTQTHSLTGESSATMPAFSSFGKTFDQDPTNLRTSYAQSLEKCNFDARDLSNSDLSAKCAQKIPKRRFQTPHANGGNAQKRNMVASTPNLNAYDPHGADVDDDMYVCSAHTSMHQLPQAAQQKPLGILITAAGSRTSISKEVSFCPVVSQYCWQEQSSEECNEPQLQRQDGQEETDDGADAAAEETDDELLDNVDATVIYNTKENEVIAARYNEEHEAATKEARQIAVAQLRAQPQALKLRAILIAKEQSAQAEEREKIEERNSDSEREREQAAGEQSAQTAVNALSAVEKTSHEVAHKTEMAKKHDSNELTKMPLAKQAAADNDEVSLKPTIVDGASAANKRATTALNTASNCNNNNNNASSVKTNTTAAAPRPLSIQLPILSQPPTNRAHHILYASQQMLDNLQRREQQQQQQRAAIPFNEPVSVRAAIVESKTKSKSVGSLCLGHKKSKNMSNNLVHYGEAPPPPSLTIQPPVNNNNELVKSKFKADEKHPSSKGFLSRFANGFRFSLRRNKKKQLQQQQLQKEQQQLPEQQQQQQQSVKAAKPAKQAAQSNGLQKTGPLTPTGTATTATATTNGNAAYDTTLPATSSASTASSEYDNNSSSNINSNSKIGANSTGNATSTLKVTGKPPLPKLPPRTSSMQSAGQHAHNDAALTTPTTAATAANFTPLTTRQLYADFLDAERSYYDDFENQLKTGMQANGCAAAATAAANNIGGNDFTSPSRASVSQKTQMFNNLQLTGNSGNGAGNNNYGRMHARNNVGNNCKIGLIETNLDTHETIISGKTRSLMDIGPQQKSSGGFKYSKRASAAGKRVRDDDNDDDDVYVGDGEDDDDDDDDIDGGGVVVKTAQTGAQIASVRRPHKSMEFLLDKENQKNVLPPENELQKSHEHNPAALSEHQLRVQASLQRLNIPDWYRQYTQTQSRSPDGASVGISGYKPGNFTRKRTTESGRWAGLNSKTTSLSSLGSQRSDRSPLLLSPSAHSHHGGQTAVATQQQQQQQQQHHTMGSATGAYGASGPGSFSRWSTSYLNSSQTSPSVSQRGSFTRGGPVNSSFMSVASGNSSGGAVRNSFRQPYLGWRSTEKLSQRTPHERLATSLLAQQQRTSPTQRTANGSGGGVKLQPVTPEIQTSIKEVTSAIVHYVNDQTNQQRSRSTSPNSRKCWLESSFVGIRPLDSPQTPIIENTPTTFNTTATANNINSNNNNNSNSLSYLNNTTAAIPILTTTGAISTATTNADVLRMNGLSLCSGGESAILI